jgi:predicted HAD superfamily hydrolase
VRKELQNLIDTHTVISFDMFDTLVHRVCGDHLTIFQLVELQLRTHELTKTYPHLGTSFAASRRQAEQTARNEREKEFGDTEVTFQEIYDVLQEMLVIPTSVAGDLMRMELEMEVRNLYADPEIKQAFEYAHKTNRPIVITSDMYLAADTLKYFLDSCGYDTSVITKIFVSCEHRKSKYVNGELFFAVLDYFPMSDICHIGDNERSDRIMASVASNSRVNRSRLTGWHYEFSAPLSFSFTPSVAQNIINGITMKMWLDKPDRTPLELIGMQIYGPLITGFLIWLLSKIEKKSYDRLLFFARDGALFHSVIERHLRTPELASERIFTKLPPIDYVYISRASITLPALFDLDVHKLSRMVSGHESRPVREWLKLYGISNAAVHLGKIKSSGFTSEEDLMEGEDPRINLLLQQLYSVITKNSEEAKHEALKYFSQFKGKKLAIVDLGWFGSLQQNFTKVMSCLGDVTVDGYYFNLWQQYNYSRTSLHDNFFAYIRDHGDELFADIPTLLQTGGVELLEDVLSAPHGTTLGYFNGEPILEDLEEVVKLDELRSAAMEFFDNILPILRSVPLSALESINWLRPFFRLIEFPTEVEANTLGEVRHSGGAGTTEYTQTPIAPKLDSTILADKQLYKLAQKAVYWKQGFKLRNKATYGKGSRKQYSKDSEGR